MVKTVPSQIFFLLVPLGTIAQPFTRKKHFPIHNPFNNSIWFLHSRQTNWFRKLIWILSDVCVGKGRSKMNLIWSLAYLHIYYNLAFNNSPLPKTYLFPSLATKIYFSLQSQIPFQTLFVFLFLAFFYSFYIYWQS